MNKEGMSGTTPDEIAGISAESTHQAGDGTQKPFNYHETILDTVPDWVW